MNTYRMPRKRVKPRRKRPDLFTKCKRDPKFMDSRSYVTKGGRYRLFGADYMWLRVHACQRANGLCECGCGRRAYFNRDITPLAEQGDFAHNEHGSRKSDELERGKWMRRECHMKSHNANGKPCPQKPMRASSQPLTEELSGLKRQGINTSSVQSGVS